MAINFTDFSRAPLLDAPWKNIFEDTLKGYKMSQEPAKMAEEQKQRQLTSKLKDLELEHKPKEYALADKEKEYANALKSKAVEYYESDRDLARQLKEAQIAKANQPAIPRGGLQQAFYLRDHLDPNAPQYQNNPEQYEKDKAKINSYIDNYGVKAGQAPPGERIKLNLPEGKEGYIEGLGKLKSGWQEVKNAEGHTIGVNVPLTAEEVKQVKAKKGFDVVYPFVNASLGEYTGKGSWERFLKDNKNYYTDPAAKKKIDDYFAAKKLLSIESTTENARIGGHATNVQLSELKKALDSSEVSQRLEKGSGFVLPKGYTKTSGDIFKRYLDDVDAQAKINVPPYEFRPINSSESSATKPSAASVTQASNQQQPSAPEIGEIANGVAIVKYNGKTLKIPERLLDRFMQEHSPSQFGGEYGR